MKELFEAFAQGPIRRGAECTEAASLIWHAHKDFTGVFLKNLLGDENTGGRLSCHLVRVEPDMSIGRHSHPDSLELHEVIAGGGICIMQNYRLAYVPGPMNVIARNVPHEVRAGGAGLYLFAKFVSLL
jgi:quercetin dioxygenase-like cupin family protein